MGMRFFVELRTVNEKLLKHKIKSFKIKKNGQLSMRRKPIKIFNKSWKEQQKRI